MRYRQIPGTKLMVSEIGFSVGTIGSERFKKDERHAIHLIRYALDRGINFFDASDFLVNGWTESLLGDALHDDRDRVILATKTAAPFSSCGPNAGAQERKFSRKQVTKACEESLKRLRTDRIDLYQVHFPNISAVECDDLFSVLKKLKRQGKIRAWGGVFGPSTGWIEESKLFLRLRKPATVQINFNLLEPQTGLELLDDAKRLGVGVMAAVPHCNSLLCSRKHAGGEDLTWRQPDGTWLETQASKAEKFSFLIQGGKRTLGQSALKFILYFAQTVCALADVYEESHINDFAMACECPDLSREEMRRIREILENDLQPKSKLLMTQDGQ